MKQTKKILYIDATNGFGGAIASLAYLLWNLEDSKYEPFVIVGAYCSFWDNSKRDIPIKIIPCKCLMDKQWVKNVIFGSSNLLGVTARRALSLFFYCLDFLIYVLLYSFRLFFATRKLGIDLIHLNNLIYRNAGGILLAKYLGIPCIVHHRDFEYNSPIVRLLAKFVDYHIAISQCIKQDLLNLGILAEKIVVVPEGIDLKEYVSGRVIEPIKKEFDVNGNKLTFGIIGIFVRWKGHSVFLKAAKKVFDTIPNSRAFVIGDATGISKTYRNELIELAVNLGISNRVLFTGYRRNISDFVEMLDVVVHTSIQPEPFGRVIIEGMAMRKSVIASKLGAPLEIVVDGKTGILVEPNNPDKLAEAIIDLLQHKEKRDSLGKAAHKVVAEKYTIKRHTELMELLYNRIFEKSHG